MMYVHAPDEILPQRVVRLREKTDKPLPRLSSCPFCGVCPEPVLMKKLGVFSYHGREMVEAEGKGEGGGEGFPPRVWQRRPLRRVNNNNNYSHSHVSTTTTIAKRHGSSHKTNRSLSPYR